MVFKQYTNHKTPVQENVIPVPQTTAQSLSKKQTRGPKLVFITHLSKYSMHWWVLKAAG